MKTKSTNRMPFICGLMLLGLLVVPGCSAVGAIGHKVFGAPKAPADYEPKQEAMLVLADAYGSNSDLQPYADQIAQLVVMKLNQNQVVPLIDQNSLIKFRSEKGVRYNDLKIPEIGSALNARQVLYIHLKDLSTSDVASDVVKASIKADVRIVSVATGQTLWPDIGSTHELKSPTHLVRKEGAQTAPQARGEMMDQLAEQVARLFYSHAPDFQDKGAE